MDRAAALYDALGRRGAAWTAPLEWSETLPSTNDVLKGYARDGAPEWSVVCASAQTGGRGREGHTWASPPGGLYLSVLLRPEFASVGLVPLAAGVAVAETAAEFGVEAELKWPNDALVRGGKVAGILTESASGATGVDWVVVGVGVNVVVDPVSLEATVSRSVTSLHLEADQVPAIETVAAGVLARLRVWYDALESHPASVVDAWRARSLPWWGRRVQVRTAQGFVRGKLNDIDETGALLLDLDEGGRRRVLSGEVTQLRPLDPSSRET